MSGTRDDQLAATVTDVEPESRKSRSSMPPTLGRYRIEHELGAGGMGVVYAAFDPDLERRVALKILRDGIPVEAEQRLLREARAMARLTHPNVVNVYEVGSVEKRDFIAMELIDGEPLVDWLRAGTRSEAAILDAYIEAGRGLAAAHAAGMVHRDFKPHNVLRRRDGHVVVTDFGLAREAADPLAVTGPPTPPMRNTPSKLSGLTEPGSMLGTPAYMAPEQWSGGKVTPATDQFAFCVALWEALAGERPFRGPTIETLFDQITRGPAELDATAIPRRLRPVLIRGLDVDPNRRWPSMEMLLARIAPRRRRTAIAIAIAIVGAAALAATITIVALRDEGPTDQQRLRDDYITAAWTAQRTKQVDEAIASYDHALSLGAEDWVAAERIELLLARRYPQDLETARRDLEPLRAKGGELGSLFDWLDATAAWWAGDVGSAHGRLVELHRRRPDNVVFERRVTGTVVDAAGQPVAGATVASGEGVIGDSVGVAVPLYFSTPSIEIEGMFNRIEIVTTDERGGFSFVHVPRDSGTIVAQQGDDRVAIELPIRDLTLRLKPTSRIRGRVALGGRIGGLTAYASTVGQSYAVAAPISRTGEFVLDRVVRGPVVVTVTEPVVGEHPLLGFFVQKTVELGAAPIEDLAFELPATRPVKVLVRRTQAYFDEVTVWIFPGTHDASSYAELLAISQRVDQGAAQAAQWIRSWQPPPSDIAAAYRADDKLARFERAPIGEATVCAFSQTFQRFRERSARVRCQPLAANAVLVVLEMPD